MKKLIILAVAIFASGLVSGLYAQNEDKQPSPEEVAAKEVKTLTEYLKLSEAQEFYVDSIITHDYVALKAAIDDLQASGRQDIEIYKQTKEQWTNKMCASLKKVLDDQQYIRYLKRIGKGKEYKKGKDGKYYKKVK